MSKLAIILGVILLALALGTAPMSLTVTLENPARNVTIYPNTLFAIPLILLGSLLLLYGITVKKPQDTNVG
jgi:peptidoglycan/LPS O-acetylase OafA/YrhL